MIKLGRTKRSLQFAALGAASALALTACGGGSNSAVVAAAPPDSSTAAPATAPNDRNVVGSGDVQLQSHGTLRSILARMSCATKVPLPV